MSPKKSQKKTNKTKQSQESVSPRVPMALIILDGFGIADKKNPGNAITSETAPHIFGYMKKYPTSHVITYGEDVGLFPGQQGNSEAGHMNIGAGRIVKQDLRYISDAIHDGTFFKNEAFRQAIYHVKKYKTAVHLMGLLTDGNSAHAYPEHIYALLELCRREGVEKVYIHLFTDGRDSGPHAALTFLHNLRGHMLGQERIATVMGRLYGMDRNKIWTRTEQAYHAMVGGKGHPVASAEEAIEQAYNREESDEFIEPSVIVDSKGRPVGRIQDNDAVIFFNARSDRARQITKSFIQEKFNQKNPGSFRRNKIPKNIRFVAMTDFGPDLEHVLTAFPSAVVDNTLPLALSHITQLYVAESEKYAHVTYFINGGYADPVNGEDRLKVESKKVPRHDSKPEMVAQAITRKVMGFLKNRSYDFYCMNFANPDMVGHTGNLQAAKTAVSITDTCVHEIVTEILKQDGQVLITADHGNAEEMINIKTGEIVTEHSLNPVPCIVIRSDAKKIQLSDGILADIAPTVLKLLSIDQPKEMTGKPLF